MSQLTKVLRRHCILPKKIKRNLQTALPHGPLDTEDQPTRKYEKLETGGLARAAGEQPEADADRMNCFEEYFAGKELTVDWTTYHFGLWAPLLETKRTRSMQVLEIGSFEGRSALFFLNYLPKSTVVCIEPFTGNMEHLDPTSPHFAEMSCVEKRFDENLASFHGRVEKRKGVSADVIPQLACDDRRFDLIYVDGDHHAISAYRDAALSWPLLISGGIMIFDDYQWELHRPVHERPQKGIDAFLGSISGEFRDLHRGYQVIVEKL